MQKLFRPYILALAIILALAGCSSTDIQNSSGTLPANSTSINTKNETDYATHQKIKKTQPAGTPATSSKTNGSLKVHFINVGQGDSELIQTPDNKLMLIDAGTNESTNSLVTYLKNQKIQTIDYLVLTHPHEDHIGGADAVIKDFKVLKVYMPKVTTTTKTFEDVLSAMKSKGLKASQPAAGTSFNLGETNCTILGPIHSDPDDLNTTSIVLKLAYGKTSFLFTGDTQVSNEEDMINKRYNLSATVLKVGHHGSYTSTSQGFLDAVKPKYAVISCEKGNDYGHPHQETMDKLKAAGIPVYRTDENGTIIALSDGKSISFNVNPGDYTSGNSISRSANPGSNSKSVTLPAAKTAPGAYISANLDNTTPTQNTRINLSVTGPMGAPYTAVCHYKSKDTTFNGEAGSPLNIDIGRASKGFTVVIDITVTYNGKTYTAQTSFTPK